MPAPAPPTHTPPHIGGHVAARVWYSISLLLLIPPSLSVSLHASLLGLCDPSLHPFLCPSMPPVGSCKPGRPPIGCTHCVHARRLSQQPFTPALLPRHCHRLWYFLPPLPLICRRCASIICAHVCRGPRVRSACALRRRCLALHHPNLSFYPAIHSTLPPSHSLHMLLCNVPFRPFGLNASNTTTYSLGNQRLFPFSSTANLHRCKPHILPHPCFQLPQRLFILAGTVCATSSFLLLPPLSTRAAHACHCFCARSLSCPQQPSGA